MPRYHIVFYAVFLAFVYVTEVSAAVIARIEIQQGSASPDNVDIKLFDELTPVSVTNFLNYVNDGDYANTFLHRNSGSFLLGGRFSYDGGAFVFGTGGVQLVPVDPPIANEFAHSNTRGTLFMAPVGGDPDSATSVFGINHVDNSALLNPAKWTVFGEIINDGMSVIDTIAALPVSDQTAVHAGLNPLPLVDYISGPINNDHLVSINNIEELFSVTTRFRRASISGDTIEQEDIDFGRVTVGRIVTATVTIENRQPSPLTIGAVASTDPLASPYQFKTNACANVVLAQNENCEMTISFAPDSRGTFYETFNVEFSSINMSYKLNIHGQGEPISTLVRMEIQRGLNPPENIDFRLFNELTPVTVQNFFNYVDDGDYTNAFFQRTQPGVFTRAGGFTYDTSLNGDIFNMASDIDNPGGVELVPTDPPIINEFARSNTRGTLAMTDTTFNITSQWHVNLADNSASFDPDRIPVFGEVINNTMDVVDAIAAEPVVDKSDVDSLLHQLPVVDYISGNISEDHLIKINSIKELITITSSYDGQGIVIGDTPAEPEDVDFGSVVLGNARTVTVTLNNRDSNTLITGDIATTDPLSAPFQITADTCSNTSLAQSERCTLSITYTPLTEGEYTDSINVEFGSLGISYTMAIRGAAALVPPVTIAPSKSSVEFEQVKIYDPEDPQTGFVSMYIANEGTVDLNIYSLSATEEFVFRGDCEAGSFGPIGPGEACSLDIGFRPSAIDLKTGTLTIYYEDSGSGVLTIPLSGTGSFDNDKVHTDIENLAPNNGDGNNDDIQDSRQDNVISAALDDGGYITFVASDNSDFVSFTMLDDSDLMDVPANIRLHRPHRYLTNAPPVINADDSVDPGLTSVGIILPKDVRLHSFYLYGPTPDDTNPHWYEFNYDPETGTGASILGNVTLQSPSGDTIKRSMITLNFVDGERGDSDLQLNGVVSVEGGYADQVPQDNGYITPWMLLLIIMSLVLRNDKFKASIRWRYH